MRQAVETSLETGLLVAQDQAIAQLRAVRQRYVSRYALAGLLPFLAAGSLLLALLRHWPAIPSIWVGLTGLSLLAALAWWLWPLHRLDHAAVARRLDRQFAELQDSSGLLLQDPAELPFLSQLQFRRVARQLAQLTASGPALLPFPFKKPLALSAGFLLAAAVIFLLPPARPMAIPTAIKVHFTPDVSRSTVAPAAPRIAETRLLVTPPAYTHQAAFVPAQASFQCPQGARVRWQVRVSGQRRPAPELEVGTQRRRMQPVAGQPRAFAIELLLNASTLYRLRYAGTVSDDYAIDVRPDQAPVLRISTPTPYTLVAAMGQRPEVPIRATVRDDYGLSRAELVITVAQGQGEAVKFREVRRDLSAGLAGQPAQANLSSQLNLPRLGLTYGDELYFYLTARDNHGHTTRTDAYLVQWQDTAVADGALSLGMGVKVAPTYFRSQRQIIIDTEKLIAEKLGLDAATVASRASALGFDQQTLRLRYGKFLGEEMEAGMGVAEQHSPIAEDDETPASHPAPTAEEHDEHDHAAPLASAAKASPTAETDALMEPYMHRHDDAETADFLEPAVKAKLRAVLDQMWASELRLRTGQLKAALPYEYRALRLLKEVQQQTRAFVKKAGFTPPPMPEATLRLTGELAGAAAPHRQQTLPAPANQPMVRAALRWLAAAENGQPSRPADAVLLDQAGAVLAGAALERPGAYLPALRALRQLVSEIRAGQPACAACRAPIVRALTDVLAVPAPAPVAPPAPNRLARRYFQELNY